MTALAIAAPAPLGAGLRLFELAGDCCGPELRGGDFLMVADTARFLYDAVYLLDFGDGEAPFVVSRSEDGFAVRQPNPKYARHTISRADLQAAVTAIVVAEVRVKDQRLVRDAANRRIAA
ncbi:MAG: hypothetical protein JNK30_21125 [Phenylobacterium sp.]|uniref:hypothetical protein n=1 Tax=Phenylobacterium sp. TaxID=1871053 RepID=UPI001A4B213E|nr:hypothetical protein [Phenylobacterium sp.]MBL8773903.1 hypothetical protein [Phenylobacterium sp.]